MAGTVNRVPPGLLSLLDLKAMGQNPTQLSDAILPTLDLYRNYIVAMAALQDGNTTAAVNATGIFPFQVGLANPGELLIVPSAAAAATAVLGAATTIRVRGGVYDIPTAQMIDVGPSVTATTGERPCVEFPPDMILMPGQGLAIFCESFLGGGVAATYRFAGQVTRLKV